MVSPEVVGVLELNNHCLSLPTEISYPILIRSFLALIFHFLSY